MKTNSALFKLYEKHWENFVRHGRATSPTPTNPMMLSFDEAAYASSTLRVMICGQETKGWDVIGATPQEGMETYNQFFIRRNFYGGYGRSSYWKAFRFFEREFPKLFETDKIQFIYQNISKVGRADDAGITDSIRKLEREYFPVFVEEMRILNPDIVIFLTGGRDHDIRFHFPDVEFS